jgi:hypothetical protein
MRPRRAIGFFIKLADRKRVIELRTIPFLKLLGPKRRSLRSSPFGIPQRFSPQVGGW